MTSGKNIVSSTLPVNLGLVEIRIRSESESESGFIGQVSFHKLTQNIHYNTIQNKQCNGLRSLRKFKKVYTQGGMAIYSSCETVAQRRSVECEKCRDKYINICATVG